MKTKNFLSIEKNMCFSNLNCFFCQVTLVNNLELYGINLAEFSRECQHGVAASTTINNLPSAKSAQLQIQGNQVLFVGKILTGEFLYLIALYNLVPISLICLKDLVGSHVSSED